MQWKTGEGDILIMYADTIFRPSVFENLLSFNSVVTVGVDYKWRDRLNSSSLISNAEKVIIKNNAIERGETVYSAK